MKKITEGRIMKLVKFSYETSLNKGTPLTDRLTGKPLSIDELFQKAKKVFNKELEKN